MIKKSMNTIKHLGHSAFQITINGTNIFIDPWITGNPQSPINSTEDIQKADIILITHDHQDHGFDDGVEITKKHNATFVSMFELGNLATEQGVAKVVSGNIGGTISFQDFQIIFFQSVHSSTLSSPCGFVVKHPELTLYHPGDTALFGDMQFLQKYEIDVALLPIGGTFTMDIDAAVEATRLIKPKTIIPMHYDTFPAIQADPGVFKSKNTFCKTEVLKPGEILEV